MVYVAMANTENYQFVGIGTTEKQAKRAILKKFNEWAYDRMTLEEFEDYYGIFVEAMNPGEAHRW